MVVVRSRTIGVSPKAWPTALAAQHLAARAIGFLQLRRHTAHVLAARAALAAQRFEGAHPAFVARAPGLDALPEPRLLLRQLLVEPRGVFGLDPQLAFALREVGVVGDRIAP
jgi:hypothetical protein